MEQSREFIAGHPESDAESARLQKQLLDAVSRRDDKALAGLREKYAERYPDQLEGITALLELNDFFVVAKQLKEHHESGAKRQEKIEYSTQYRFLLTHFILQNTERKEWLENFWQAAETMAVRQGNIGSMQKLRWSILSQIAVMRTLEAMGKEAKLSHPTEDAFHAVDLWTDKHEAVQIKGLASSTVGPVVAETDTITFPAIRSAGRMINSNLAHEFGEFRLKLEEYGQQSQEKLHGFMVVVPYSQFDYVTGEPSQDFIAGMKDKLPQAEQVAAA